MVLATVAFNTGEANRLTPVPVQSIAMVPLPLSVRVLTLNDELGGSVTVGELKGQANVFPT